MSNPWKKISEPVNVQKLTDIMSEELVKARQNIVATHVSNSNITSSSIEVSQDILQHSEKSNMCGNFKSDSAIAKAPQCQFDKQHDDEFNLYKAKHSGDLKVPLSFNYYHDVPENLVDRSDSEDEFFTEKKNLNVITDTKKAANPLLKKYFVTKDGRMVTKSDSVISSKRGGCRVLQFSPKVSIEEGDDFNLKLPHPVLNQLNMHTMWNQACMPKMLGHNGSQLRKDTAEVTLDESSKIILRKLMINKMLLDITVIATSEEAVVLHGYCDPTYPEKVLPKECAIKVFKTAIHNFRGRNKYIEPEKKFKDIFSTKINKVVHMWTEKEMNTLITIRKLGLNCPEIICLDKEVLVMSFIGKDSKPAALLRDVLLKPDQWQSVYNDVVAAMHKLYNEGHLILADLPELNILWWESKCWFIDVAQSVRPDQYNAFKLLHRVCNKVVHFFKKKGVTKMKTTDELFTFITDLKEGDVSH